MIKAIIFDFFDVIRTDAYKSWLKANNIPREGGYFKVALMQDMGEITGEQFRERLSKLTGRTVTFEEIDASAKVDYEVVKIAESLKPNYKLALLSNASSAFIRGLLTDHDLEQYFDEVIVSSEVGMVKPNADVFHHTLQKLGVDPTEAIFIDDNPSHTQAAEKLGIKSITFTDAAVLIKELDQLGIKASV